MFGIFIKREESLLEDAQFAARDAKPESRVQDVRHIGLFPIKKEALV